MPSPFPGMDPYLEAPDLWPDVHLELISKIRSALNPRILPNYIARVETRVYISREDDPGRKLFAGDVSVEKPAQSKAHRKPKSLATIEIAEPIIIPQLMDDEIEEARIEIKDRKTNTLVTVIEVLSPSNKVRGSEGRESFMEKRREIMASEVHWVEIDLLREGAPSVVPILKPSDYHIFVSRSDDRRHIRCWPVDLRQKLPVIGIPLKGSDADVPLDLGAILSNVYDQASYGHVIDYRKPPLPPLTPANARWAKRLLRQKKLR
jgi:hypothetical protein